MLKIISAIILSILALSIAYADTYVNGYYKKNGTYVQPHYRSSPDSSYNNNWSVKPNVNPYTGKQGTRNPTWNNQAPKNNTYNYNYGNSYNNGYQNPYNSH